MRIREIIWPEDRIDHIARHGITPDEFEQVCFGQCLVLRAKSEGENPVFHVLGITNGGRYLLCIVIRFPDGRGFPITARPMTPRKKPLSTKETAMNQPRIPNTDSIQELAKFWDEHDLAYFEDQLE
jgi:hypothetical protein